MNKNSGWKSGFQTNCFSLKRPSHVRLPIDSTANLFQKRKVFWLVGASKPQSTADSSLLLDAPGRFSAEAKLDWLYWAIYQHPVSHSPCKPVTLLTFTHTHTCVSSYCLSCMPGDCGEIVWFPSNLTQYTCLHSWSYSHEKFTFRNLVCRISNQITYRPVICNL